MFLKYSFPPSQLILSLILLNDVIYFCGGYISYFGRFGRIPARTISDFFSLVTEDGLA